MVYNLSFPILGGVYDVDKLDNESQEHQHRKYDDHIGQTDGERAWRCHRADHLSGKPPFLHEISVSLNHTPVSREKISDLHAEGPD